MKNFLQTKVTLIMNGISLPCQSKMNNDDHQDIIFVDSADATSFSCVSSRCENRQTIETIKNKWSKMSNFQDLPDELVVKVLSYFQVKDLISYYTV